MELLVGQRAEVNPTAKEAFAVLSMFMWATSRATTIEYSGFCSGCGTLVTQTLSENVQTGQIWARGEDFCPKCGHKLVSDDLTGLTPLSQDCIKKLFGEF